MTDFKKLKEKINNIENRNKKVEADKSWETSYMRRFLLAIFTYLAIGFYFQAINISQPWLNAIVPALALMISMLTLPFFKKIWLKYIYKR